MLFSRAFELPGPRWVRVESEQDPGWDDIVEEIATDDGQVILCGWQVKLQTTALEAEDFAGMLRQLHGSTRLDHGCLCFPGAVEVRGVGKTSALQELCRRASEPGCDAGSLAPTKEEAAWWTFLGKIVRPLDRRFALLRRLEVKVLHDAREIESTALARLKHLFSEPTEPIFRSIEAFFGSIEDPCVVDVDLLDQKVLRPFVAQRLPTPPTIRGARVRYLAEVRAEISARLPLAGLAIPQRILLRDVRVPLRQLNGPVDDGTRRLLHDWLLTPQDEARTLILLGEVGSGKTELLTLTAETLAASAEAAAESPVPLLLNARALVAADLEHAARARWPAACDALLHLLQASTTRWIVLLDGLDEAGAHGLDALNALRRRLGDRLHALVASTRPSPWPSLPGAIEVWIPPWTPEETEQFLVLWAAHAPHAVANLRRSPHQAALSMLCANPLTATLCLVVAKQDPGALRSRASVYASVVEWLFDSWAGARARLIGGDRMAFTAVSRVLQELALEIVRRERSTISRQDLRTLLRREVSDRVLTVEAAIELELGVLVRSGEDAYEFAVRGLAEHLAGRGLLEGGDPEVVQAASAQWAEEASRHAVGWAALTRPERAIGLLRSLLHEEEDDDIVTTNVHLRSVLVAIRGAADLGEIAEPIADALIDACSRRLLDETSLWVGDRVADAVRDLMRSGARCWTPLAKMCFAFACDPRVDRAAWYEAQTWEDLEIWANVLHERDPEVRRVAVERLGYDVTSPENRERLTLETMDSGWRIGGSPPAIAAALALRRARRDDHFEKIQPFLLSNLQYGSQLIACAAAVALRPGEASPEFLAKALESGAIAFQFPREIIEDLARDPDGRSALDESWPTWNDAVAREPVARPPLPACSAEEPAPVSEQVRNRLVRAVAPALRRGNAVKQLLSANRIAAPDALCELAYDHPDLVSPILKESPDHRLSLLSASAVDALGRAALRHPTVRDQLIELWGSIGPRSSLPPLQAVVRQLYPGHALEPLVRRGDTGAIEAYAEWLPDAPLLVIGLIDPTPIAPELLVPEPIRKAAREVVDRVWRYVTEGMVNESTGVRSFLAPTTAGSVLHCLNAVWSDDVAMRSELDTWLSHKDVNRFTAALQSLEGLTLPLSTQTIVGKAICARLEAGDDRHWLLETIVLPHALRFIHRTGLTAMMRPLLERLVKIDTPVACHAAAVLIPLLEEGEGTRLSRAVAEGRWLEREPEMIDASLLRRMVQLAPEAWAMAIKSAVTSSSTPLTVFLSPFVEALPITLKRNVLLAWAGTAGALDLPWSWEGASPMIAARPADRVRQLLFDHGFEQDDPVSRGLDEEPRRGEEST